MFTLLAIQGDTSFLFILKTEAITNLPTSAAFFLMLRKTEKPFCTVKLDIRYKNDLY